jgi:hypothetical protein
MALTEITDYRYPQGWQDAGSAQTRARQACERLEAGDILFFASLPYQMSDEDRQFLLSQKQSDFKVHKNISYRPAQDLLRGGAGSPEEQQRLAQIMRGYSRAVTDFLSKVLAPYAGKWTLDFASFRPVQEQHRDLSIRKRNDRMHVDAFPTRPTHGARILRCFTNINPQEPRIWETTADGFESLAKHFAGQAGLKEIASAAHRPTASVQRALAPLLKAVGIKGADRSAYDRFMLGFHDYLKENEDFQQSWPRKQLVFPPGSTWIVYTDSVPHAALKGQFAMEQTYMVPISAMVTPERAPLRVLESLCGTTLSA